jgi:heme-degrading monooxygenase HmoA
MIIREWRARARPEAPEAYPDHFSAVVAPELHRLAGFRGATLARRRDAGRIVFTVFTRWDSLAAVRGFAGDDAERAVVDPVAIAALADYDDTVRHHEVIAEVAVPPRGP